MRQSVTDRQLRRPSLDGSWRRRTVEDTANLRVNIGGGMQGIHE